MPVRCPHATTKGNLPASLHDRQKLYEEVKEVAPPSPRHPWGMKPPGEEFPWRNDEVKTFQDTEPQEPQHPPFDPKKRDSAAKRCVGFDDIDATTGKWVKRECAVFLRRTPSPDPE